MSDIAIQVENLSKLYTLGSAKSGSLYDAFGNLFKKNKVEENSFWALDDLNFEIKHGQAVGIIGRNGAGKSTLLKVLSRITQPTKGRFTLNGRVSSLLEVGTGFHPELSGRENIFLNGTILGMSRSEIKSKLDEIIDFSGVEDFLDTPVKHYSSGMYVRLAFAVAAHLEPEILIIDEVLAVGDAQFQKKCLGKMSEVTGQGRTVLFVSHQMNAIESFCNSIMVLNKGTLQYAENNVRKGIELYLKGDQVNKHSATWTSDVNDVKNDYHTVTSLSLVDEHNNPASTIVTNDSVKYIKIEGEILQVDSFFNIGYALFSEVGDLLYWTFTTDVEEEQWINISKGNFSFRSLFPVNLLNEGSYSIEVISSLHFKEWLLEPGMGLASIKFEIKGGLSQSPYWIEKRKGILAPIIKWESTL